MVGYQFWFVDQNFLNCRTLKLSVVEPNKHAQLPYRYGEDEFFFVLKCIADFFLDADTRVAGPYTSFYCPLNSLYDIINVGDTELKYLVIKKYNLN